MLKNWVHRPLYNKDKTSIEAWEPIETIEILLKRLQGAMLVELSTIPVYLSILFSIVPGTN